MYRMQLSIDVLNHLKSTFYAAKITMKVEIIPFTDVN